MGEREIVKKYSNGDLNIVWKPKLCIHSGVCVKILPEVYSPKEKPWKKAENASIEELKSQIAKCPSGALSYEMKNEKQENNITMDTKVEVRKNGPLLVHGDLMVSHNENTEKKTRITAFCRCGESGNKPYCDGTHNEIKFQG